MNGSNLSSQCLSITANSLAVGYEQRIIIAGIDLSIAKGTITALVGPNGSGKSTLIKALARLLKPSTGCVLLDGEDIAKLGTRSIARRLSLLPQGPLVPEGLTVGQLVAYGRAPHQGLLGLRTDGDDVAVERALIMTRIEALRDTAVDALSGGQRQRVWIAMALAQETEVMLLDEPTTYLDIAHQIDVLELLQKLNRDHERTIIMVLHDLNFAARYSDRMIVLRQGRLIADGSPATVLVPSILREAFEIEADIHHDPSSGRPWFVPRQALVRSRKAQK